MHYQLEIIMPPMDESKVEGFIGEVMEPWGQEYSDKDGDDNPHAFFDWYQLGGRWSGNKMLAVYGADRIKEFWDWCATQKLTVSNFTAGKQELQPKSQEASVDAKWNEMFPPSDGVAIKCPLFKHGGEGLGVGDIMRLKDVSMETKCARVMLLSPSAVPEKAVRTADGEIVDYSEYWTGPTCVRPQEMMVQSMWNGVSWQETCWDGTIGQALDLFAKKMEGRRKEYAESATPKDDWLVVTVDYHN